jgi:GntR family transcriptional regulator
VPNRRPSRDDPPYRRIVEDIRQLIERGELADGDRLPTLDELVAEYQVTKATAQKAMLTARAEGLAYGRAGEGVFARVWRPIRRVMPDRLSDAISGQRNTVHDSDTAGRARGGSGNVARVQVDGEVARALQLPDGAECIRRDRVFQIDGRSVQMTTSWYPVWLVGGTAVESPDTGPGGTPRRLTELGHRPARYVETLRVRPPTRAEIDTLGLEIGVRVVDCLRISCDAQGTPVETSRMIFDESAYVFTYRGEI